MKILIVDDDQGTLNALSVGLTSFDFQIVTAKNAAEALGILESSENGNKQVEFIITDLKMPGMNGLELIQSAGKLIPDLSAILITAYGNRHVYGEVMKLARCGYLEKPFTPEALIDKINEIKALS